MRCVFHTNNPFGCENAFRQKDAELGLLHPCFRPCWGQQETGREREQLCLTPSLVKLVTGFLQVIALKKWRLVRDHQYS
jgi:hypothetical protein